MPERTPLLRLALRLDAAVTGVNGAAYLVAAGPLSDLLGLPAARLRAAGAFLLAFAAAVAWVATRPDIPRRAAIVVAAANAAWVAESAAAAIGGWGTPATVGVVWIVLQALVVAAFLALQVAGLRRAQQPMMAN